MSDTIIVYGAGGHARVVLDVLMCRGVKAADIYVIDDKRTGSLDGVRIRRPKITASLNSSAFVVAIGNNDVRRRLHAALAAEGHFPLTAVHPFAYVSPLATVGHGTVVCAQAVVAPGAVLGEGCIVNHHACVDHDCFIGPFTHIAPKASLCGAVRVGAMCLIGAGATLLPGSVIGDHATVGGQGLVKAQAEVAEHKIVAGVPVKEIRR